jgi:hypothetical protein
MGQQDRMSPPDLFFNGLLGSTGEYFYPPTTIEALAASIREDEPPSLKAPLAFLEASDPGEVGWGVVFTPTIDPAVRNALKPLLDQRRGQAGELFRELTYWGGTWLQFLADHGASPSVVDPERLPYYLLLVGSPQEIPFDFQCQLDIAHAVGRLSFATPEEYARYAAGVLASERREVVRPRRLDIFGVRNDDDFATGLAENSLVLPLAAALDGHGWEVRRWLGSDAHKARLTSLLGGEDSSALLLTSSHGVCYWPDDIRQETDQGGLVCRDWPGPKKWKNELPAEHYFAARDVADQADVRGQIHFQFACFTAGTPRFDSFSRAKHPRVPEIAPRELLSALPRRLLGHPAGGALAVIGHIDQAWPQSLLWQDVDQPQIAHFQSAFRLLMAGRPVGWALESFGQLYANLAATLTGLLEKKRETSEPPPAKLWAHLWMAHNDARSFVLLGDPAVRLPGTEG